MSQAYSNPERETDPHALPNCEVFYYAAEDGGLQDEDGEPFESGWYWWACFPGCLPDGEPMGPFDTEDAAIEDAQLEEW